jgi:hypothetical protein
MIQIENEEFKKLLANIRLAFGAPSNKAAWSLGRLALTTLEDYLKAAEEKPQPEERDVCDECGNEIPPTGGSLANKYHKDTCSLHDPNGE